MRRSLICKEEVFPGENNVIVGRPIRTCLGCGAEKNKKNLWRLTLNKDDGVITWDTKNLLGGRGVYCCPDRVCVHRLLKNKKRLTRAFRVQVAGWSEASVLLSPELTGIKESLSYSGVDNG
ncbi:MAG: YlxR family protein [Proteobacteria bacterium]|nr:YlxR family protein [Pseudomonadota bacterium]MBU1716196.1 YlxR family protein [Pseudomonadota bacterium]